MRASHFSPDIQEFIRLLSKYKVHYVIVGGEAVIYYGHARLTGDVDFFYEASLKNVMKLYNALSEFWNGKIPGIKSQNELLEKGMIIQFGLPPNRIDLINQIEAVTFKDAWDSKKNEKIKIKKDIYPVYFIGINQLIKNKEAIKRFKDLEDLKFLKSSTK